MGASIQDKFALQQVLEDYNNENQSEKVIHFLRQPPHHPELNPIERLWRDMKLKARVKNCASGGLVENVKEILKTCIEYLSEHDKCEGYFAEALIFENKIREKMQIELGGSTDKETEHSSEEESD
ncbi:hypothetical protein HDE_12650 [Halotydeus destructor]|nr:hypothetical protein HDE_12650 [Halotydeus destructor]